jgi:hypothetical protein
LILDAIEWLYIIIKLAVLMLDAADDAETEGVDNWS